MSYRLHLAILGACFSLSALVGCGSSEDPTTPASSQSTTTGAASGGTGSGGESSSSSSGAGASSSSAAGGTGGSASGGSGPGGSSTGGSGGVGTGGSSAGGTVRFAALGDQGKGNQGQKDVATALAAKCAQDGCDFVQLLGDNIYDSGVDSTADPQWQDKFELPYAAINVPFWVVLGNHDYGGGGTGNEFGKAQNEIDYTQVSTKWKLPAAYYTRTEKHVDFFGLDTNMAMYHQADQQEQDVGAWIAASNNTWKIAMGHHPYLSNGPHGNAGEYEGLPFVPIVNGAGVKDLMDAIICGQVDVYLSGHDHSLQWLVPTCGGTTELIVSGAGAATTELPGNNQTHFQSLSLGFLYVVIQDNVLTGEFIDPTGAVLYTRVVTK
jgi:hypothetical protein